MERDLWLINDLHQYIIANPRAVHALRILTQIYSKHGLSTEAAQTAKNLLDIDDRGLDQETYDSLSPTAVDILERPYQASRPGSTESQSISQGDVNRSTSHDQSRPESLLPPPHSPRVSYNPSSITPNEQSSRQRKPPQSPISTGQHVFPTTLRSQSTRNNPTGLLLADDLRDTASQSSRFNFFPSLSFRSKSFRRKNSVAYEDREVRVHQSQQLSNRYSTDSHDVRRKPVPSSRLPPIQCVADQMAADPRNSLTTAINDLTAFADLTRKENPTPSPDPVRSACVARTNALAAALHPKYAYLAHQALMHTTHELLSPTYANDATMISMDPISDIPRARFFVSEDNYAWDMAELVAALQANPAAALRNPLSRAPFTEADVTAIVHHPLGRCLAAIQVSQREMRKGIRGAVVQRLEELARVMLEDEDSMEASRVAMDEFAAYLATLPMVEKEALFELRVPARDRHTGLGYDASVGEMLRDAKANQVCGHKAGDFLSQAVEYLKRPSRR